MKWYQQGAFYHIYPLGLTGAPLQNEGGDPVPRLRQLWPWVAHIQKMGFRGLYIGPLFESVGHGYETTDYRQLDRRLGTNEDLKDFVAHCHSMGLHVIFDAVFNHTGREFFAFRDLLAHREGSAYRDWYQGVDFSGDNGYHDGLRYETWGGYELLAKLNLQNPAVRQYHLDTVRFWVEEFDVDGLRLDAADVLDFGFLQQLRGFTETLKPDFWLMGEVIHGEYIRWIRDAGLHSVTNYRLHKALYSSHNDHNYFELAHTIAQLGPLSYQLYNFADNHDVERIQTRLRCKADFFPVHVLLFTLPGIPSVYYGSEFAIEGRKEHGSDASLRPALSLEALPACPQQALIARLAELYRTHPVMQAGEYRQLQLTTTVYAFARQLGDAELLVAANNGDSPAELRLDARLPGYAAPLTGERLAAQDGKVALTVQPHSAVLLLPEAENEPQSYEAIPAIAYQAPAETGPAAQPAVSAPPAGKSIDEMDVGELQSYILARMAANGPLTDRMRREVDDNRHLGSLRNWARSFR